MALLRSINSAVDGIARQTVGRDWGLYAALLDHWPEIVGADFAKLSSPVKIAFPVPRSPKNAEGKAVPPPREGGTLHIKVPRGMMMEFSYQTDQIKGRVAEFLGRSAIAKIVLEPSHEGEDELPMPKEEIILTAEDKKIFSASLEGVEDEGLRAALASLGDAVLKESKKKRR